MRCNINVNNNGQVSRQLLSPVLAPLFDLRQQLFQFTVDSTKLTTGAKVAPVPLEKGYRIHMIEIVVCNGRFKRDGEDAWPNTLEVGNYQGRFL